LLAGGATASLEPVSSTHARRVFGGFAMLLSRHPLLGLCAVALLLHASACATLKPYMRYESDKKMGRGPLSVKVEVTADREVARELAEAKDYKGLALFEERDVEAFAGTFRDALRHDIEVNGPVSIDDVNPTATLKVRVTRVEVDPPHRYAFFRYVLPVFAILGVPTGRTQVDVRTETTLVAADGKTLAEFASSADRSSWTGLYYNWEVSFSATARILGERIRGELASRQGPIAAALGLQSTTAKLSLPKPTKILVLPIRAVGGTTPSTCGLLTSFLLSKLFEVEHLSAVGKGDVEAVVSAEKQREALGCNDVTCMAELGGSLGADLVLYGELGTVGTKYNLNVSVVDSTKAKVAARASLVVEQNEDKLMQALPGLVADVVGKLNTAPSN
jgi:hypothetical protein